VSVADPSRPLRTQAWSSELAIAHDLQEAGVKPFCHQQEPGVARKVGQHFREHVTAR
jgi:hypothetical protein